MLHIYIYDISRLRVNLIVSTSECQECTVMTSYVQGLGAVFYRDVQGRSVMYRDVQKRTVVYGDVRDAH